MSSKWILNVHNKNPNKFSFEVHLWMKRPGKLSFKVITLYLRALSFFFHNTSGKINPIYSTHNTQRYKVNTLPKQFVKEPILKHNLFIFFIHHHPSQCCCCCIARPPFIYMFPSFHRDPTEFQSSNRGCSPSAALTLTLLFIGPFDDVTRHMCTCEGPETIQLFVCVCLEQETGPYCQGCACTVIVHRHHR